MKIDKNEKAIAWCAMYAVAFHALIAGGAKGPSSIDARAKELADAASETVTEKLKEMEEQK